MRDRGRSSNHFGSNRFESRDNLVRGRVDDPWHLQRVAAQNTQQRSEADEFASYHTDFDLQVALEQDESQGLYEEQAQYYHAQQTAITLPTTTQHGSDARTGYGRAPASYNQGAYNYQTQAPHAQQRAPSAPYRPQPAGATVLRTARQPVAARPNASAAARGRPTAPRTAAHVAQLPAARSAKSGIRNAPLASVAPAQARYGAAPGRALPQPRAAQQPLQRNTRQPASVSTRQAAPAFPVLLDDEPLPYPRARGRGWLGKLVVVLLLAGAGYAARNAIELPAALRPAVAPLPPPAAAVAPEPEPPAQPPAVATPEPPPEAAAAAPAAPLTPAERRAAARAARAAAIAERKREREAAREARREAMLEARRARAESRASEANASTKHVRERSAEEPAHSWRAEPDEAPAPAASKPARANEDADLLAAQPARSDSASSFGRDEADADTPAQPKQRPAVADNGTLRINSRPWSVVYVDGHSVGNTPQMNLLLPAGEHQITLVNDEMQLRKTLSISINPGVVTTRTLNLAD